MFAEITVLASILDWQDRPVCVLIAKDVSEQVWAEEQLQRAQAQAQAAMAIAAAEGKPYEGGDGITVQTPNGHMTYSPHWVISNKAMEQVNKYLASFGLDPASRSKVAPSAVRQRDMFEDDEGGATPGGFNDL